jgi:outer membrane protein OmpA-like peptidoglycan-associated protein
MMAMALRLPGLCLTIALLAASTHMAAAQRVVGGANRLPEVEVDLGVLDSLGPAPTLPDLLHGQARAKRNAAAPSTSLGAAQHGALQSPRHKKKSKSTAQAGAKSSKTVASAEARAAAPVKPVAANSGTVTRPGVATTPLPDAAALAKPPMMPELPTPVPPPATPALPPPPTAMAAAPGSAPAAKAPAETAAPPAAATAPAAPAPPAPAPPAPSTPVAPAPLPPTASAPPAPAPAVNAPSAAGEKTAAIIPPPAAAPSPAVANAAAPLAVASIGDRTVRMQFAAGAEEVPDAAKTGLDDLVQKLTANEQARLQLVAYAAGGPNEANEARRLSLRRAVAVRNYLRDKGIASSRMDVRALGNRSEGSAPADRVDIVMLDR